MTDPTSQAQQLPAAPVIAAQDPRGVALHVADDELAAGGR
jgi:hypothetical protein